MIKHHKINQNKKLNSQNDLNQMTILKFHNNICLNV